MTPGPTEGTPTVDDFDPLNQGGLEAAGYGHLAVGLLVRAICVSLGSAGLLLVAVWTFLG
jgi:hypothetical protein